MAFGLTSSGFSLKRLADIKSSIEEDLKSEFGTNINTAPDSVFSKLIGVFSRELALAWELGQAVYNSQYPETADGVPLDNAVSLVGVTRLGATPSIARDVKVIGVVGTTVGQGSKISIPGTTTVFESIAGGTIIEQPQQETYTIGQAVAGVIYRIIVNATNFDYLALPGDDEDDIALALEVLLNASPDPFTATATGSTIVVVSDLVATPFTTSVTALIPQSHDIVIASVAADTLYRVTLNGANHDYTSDFTPTSQEIITGVEGAVNGGSEPVTALDDGNFTVGIQHDTPGGTYTLSISANLLATETTPAIGDLITSADTTLDFFTVDFQSIVDGQINAPGGSLTNIVTAVTGWDSVTNPFDAELGRLEETDAELRIRRLESLQIAGFSVVEAIRSQLLQNVADVIAVLVVENDDDVADGDGRPPHSFEVIIDGGDDTEIAEKIWAVKPAGIKPVSTDVTPVSIVIVDSMGFPHTIEFSRPTDKDIWLRVTWSAHPEEATPSDAEDQMQDVVLAYGDTFNIGQDVLPADFIEQIQSNVDGLFDLIVEISDDGISYQADPFRIDFRDRANFDSSRLTFVEIPPTS